MPSQRGPEDRQSTDYIEHATGMAWAPIILFSAFAILIAFLLNGTSWGPVPGDTPTVTQRTELPNTDLSAPSVSTPAPPKPQ